MNDEIPSEISDKLSEDEIFELARGISDVEARQRFLDKACKGDQELSRRVESLIEVDKEAECFFDDGQALLRKSEQITHLRQFVDDPLAEDADFDEEELRVQIGRYHLIQRLGDGGCGVVYLAEQEEPVHRLVAVKIVRVGLESPAVIERFKVERQALAMMDHSNIAHVFDAGETRNGSPYFVMEHVRGLKITAYCDEHKLDLRERLELFTVVCNAIQHAHQKGIIHGDIKPSNIMVSQQDGISMPKVIDFGVARMVESRLSKSADKNRNRASFAGTPTYMSPEQMEVKGYDVDTRSDIYSLGVLLYELISGVMPLHEIDFRGMSVKEIRKTIFGCEFPRASEQYMALEPEAKMRIAKSRKTTPARLYETLHQDIDYITGKCMERDRSLRYHTANAIGMDIQRYLDFHPVVAHPGSWSYQVRKFIRRNRGGFIAGFLVASTLIAGMSVSTLMFIREREAKQRAVAAEQQQMRLREDAEVREKIALASLLVSQGKYMEADSVVGELSIEQNSIEGASLMRSLGEWHALNGRWEEASRLFTILLEINHFDSPDLSSLDHLEVGPALIRSGDFEAYEQFRLHAIQRYSESYAAFSDRFIKIALLRPAGPIILSQLKPIVERTVENIQHSEREGAYFEAAWRSLAVALYQYRIGAYSESVALCNKTLDYPNGNSPLEMTTLALLGMNQLSLGKLENGEFSITQAREIMDAKVQLRPERGTPVYGFWFDWEFGAILLEESEKNLQLAGQR